MKNFALAVIFIVTFSFPVSSIAIDCGPVCDTCYCLDNNGFMCVDDHQALEGCTCTCTKYKSKNKSNYEGNIINTDALQDMINSYLQSNNFDYKLSSADFKKIDLGSEPEERGLFDEHWKSKNFKGGLTCSGF